MGGPGSDDARATPAAALDVLPSAVGVVYPDVGGRHAVRWGNASLAVLFGSEPEQLAGRFIEDLLIEPDQTVDRSPGWHEHLCRIAGEPRWTRWHWVVLPDGHLVQIDVIHERVLARQQAQLQSRLLELIPEPVIVRELDGTIRYWNSGASEVYGYVSEQAHGRRTHELLRTRFVDATLPEVEQSLASDGIWRGTLEHRHADGRVLRMISKHVRDDLSDGQPVVLEVNIDVTDRYAAEQALAASEAKFRSQFRDSTVGQLIRHLDGTVDEVNQAFADMVGRTTQDLVGQPADALFAASASGIDAAAITYLISGGVEEISGEGSLIRADGSLLDVSIDLSTARSPDGSVDRVIGIFHDITERKIADLALTHQALHDPLTGLANRTLLLDQIGRALTASRISGHSVGLLYLDLDGFKDVNDTYGHLTGDSLLVEVAQRLRDCVRSDDTVARLGGDEFVVLCPDLIPPGRLHAVADRVLTLIAAPYEFGGRRIDTITVSIGLNYPAPGDDPDEVVSAADRAMYEAKRSGKNRITAVGRAPRS